MTVLLPGANDVTEYLWFRHYSIWNSLSIIGGKNHFFTGYTYYTNIINEGEYTNSMSKWVCMAEIFSISFFHMKKYIYSLLYTLFWSTSTQSLLLQYEGNRNNFSLLLLIVSHSYSLTHWICVFALVYSIIGIICITCKIVVFTTYYWQGISNAVMPKSQVFSRIIYPW